MVNSLHTTHVKSQTTHSHSTTSIDFVNGSNIHSLTHSDRNPQQSQQYYYPIPSSTSDEAQPSKPLHASSLTETTNSHGPWMLIQYLKSRKPRHPPSLSKSTTNRLSSTFLNTSPKSLSRQTWVEKNLQRKTTLITNETLKIPSTPDVSHAPEQNPTKIIHPDTTQLPNPNLTSPHHSPTESDDFHSNSQYYCGFAS